MAIRKDGIWLKDENGNRASITILGGEEVARNALESLQDCTNCKNCSRCEDCTKCKNCYNRIGDK